MQPESPAPLAIGACAAALDRPESGPSSTAVAVATIAGASLSASIVLPLGTVCLLACAALLVLIAVRACAEPLRRALAENAVGRARYERRIARMRALPETSTAWYTLAELTRLVDETARRDPTLVERHELETLLDRHVALTLAHEQAQRAAAMSDRVQLERLVEAVRADPRTSRRRLELCERRLRFQEQCEATVAGLADELANIADVLRLIAQRAACPELGDEPDGDVVDRQVAQLDADEAARRVLAELR